MRKKYYSVKTFEGDLVATFETEEAAKEVVAGLTTAGSGYFDCGRAYYHVCVTDSRGVAWEN